MRLRKVSFLVGLGELEKAASLLTSQGHHLDPADDAVAERLKALFVDAPYESTAPLVQPPTGSSWAQPPLDLAQPSSTTSLVQPPLGLLFVQSPPVLLLSSHLLVFYLSNHLLAQLQLAAYLPHSSTSSACL
eukprot:m.69810 g.69810  ORF g.69810 m.69810 type:complete len:132 (-) comp50076_c0_seq14:1273-1668(-)